MVRKIMLLLLYDMQILIIYFVSYTIYEEMMKKQVKSKQRVANYGEVFTNEREVKAMCDLVKQETERIDSRFLEPACGDGNFLAEILKRKLAIVKTKYKKNPFDYEKNSLLAVSSLYGVDIMLDNVLACRKRLYKIWADEYKLVCKRECNADVNKSICYILSKNIVCGNALTLKCVDENAKDIDKPIIFSEWSFITGFNIQRSDYTFDELLNQSSSQKQLTLNNCSNNDEGVFLKKYICNYRRLWEYE